MVSHASVAALLAVAVLLSAAFRDGDRPIRPGDHIGAMVLVRGTAARADHKLFDSCDPVILRSGRYSRRCGVVPRVKRLFIGYGSFAPPTEIDAEWAASTWDLWFDRHRVVLSAFGTSDRTLFAFPPAGNTDVTLREWRVMLRNASPGKHTIRYRVRDPGGVVDATWAFTIRSS